MSRSPEEKLPRSSQGEPRLLDAAEAMLLHREGTHVFVDVREEGNTNKETENRYMI